MLDLSNLFGSNRLVLTAMGLRLMREDVREILRELH